MTHSKPGVHKGLMAKLVRLVFIIDIAAAKMCKINNNICIVNHI